MWTAALKHRLSNPPRQRWMSRRRACAETKFETVRRPLLQSNSARGRRGGRPRVRAGRARAALEAEAQLSDNGLRPIRALTEIC